MFVAALYVSSLERGWRRVLVRQPRRLDMHLLPLFLETMKSFLDHGANISQPVLVQRGRGPPLTTDASVSLIMKGVYQEGIWRTDPGQIISVVNGAYLLHRLCMMLPEVFDVDKRELSSAFVDVNPWCQDVGIISQMGAFYKISPQEADAINMVDEQDGKDFERRFPQVFSRERQVRLDRLLEEHGFMTERESSFEDVDSWAGALKWSYRHRRAREALIDLVKAAAAGKSQRPISRLCHVVGSNLLILVAEVSDSRPQGILEKWCVELSIFLSDFGPLKESTPAEEFGPLVQCWPVLCRGVDRILSIPREPDPEEPDPEEARYRDVAEILETL